MKRITNEEYDALMSFLQPKFKALWAHENEERKKRGQEELNMFQFGFSILDICHYNVDDEHSFYVIFNSSFLNLIYKVILKALESMPEKFGTGNATDVLEALYHESAYYGSIDQYSEFLADNACCYIVYKSKEGFDDNILRIDTFRQLKPCAKDEGIIEFVGGLLHVLKHFSIDQRNLSTGTYIYDVFDIHHIVYLVGMAFRLREGEGSKYKAIQYLGDDKMLASFYKEENTGFFFVNSYYKKH